MDTNQLFIFEVHLYSLLKVWIKVIMYTCMDSKNIGHVKYYQEVHFTT